MFVRTSPAFSCQRIRSWSLPQYFRSSYEVWGPNNTTFKY